MICAAFSQFPDRVAIDSSDFKSEMHSSACRSIDSPFAASAEPVHSCSAAAACSPLYDGAVGAAGRANFSAGGVIVTGRLGFISGVIAGRVRAEGGGSDRTGVEGDSPKPELIERGSTARVTGLVSGEGLTAFTCTGVERGLPLVRGVLHLRRSVQSNVQFGMRLSLRRAPPQAGESAHIAVVVGIWAGRKS